MGLTAGQIPKVANVLNGGVAKLSGSLNVVAIGVDTNGATAYSASASGGRVISMMGSTDDTVTSNIFVWINRSSTVIPVGLVNIPLSSGNTNAARFPVDFLNGTNLPGLPVDNTGRQYIPLLANDTLRVGASGSFSAGKSAWISTHGIDFQT